jgi:septal ring factor EnvC (AmiA/AmiB activator)
LGIESLTDDQAPQRFIQPLGRKGLIVMRKSNVVFCSVISLFILVITGCASKPTTADIMREHANDSQSRADLKNRLAKDWEKGTKLVSSGEKRVKDGENIVKSAERDLKRGQDDIEWGNREIADGQKLIQESERQFRENFPDQGIKPVN